MSSSKSYKQPTLTQIDYVRTGPSVKRVKRELDIDSSSDEDETEIEVLKVTPPSKVKGSSSKSRNVDVDLYDTSDKEDDEDFLYLESRIVARMEDPLLAGNENHVGAGGSTWHLVDPKYAGYFNNRTSHLMRVWADKVVQFVKELKTKAGVTFRGSKYEVILDLVINQVRPLESYVRDFDGMVIKVMNVEFLMGFFAVSKEVVELLHYFSRSTSFKIEYVPTPRFRDFNIETTFSCGKTWIFEN